MIREWVKKRYGLFDIKDLKVGGNCGCCGASLPDEILPVKWPWGLCKKCPAYASPKRLGNRFLSADGVVTVL